MDPSRYSGIIKEGDLVILYSNPESLHSVYAKEKAVFDNKFGAFHHDDFIGKKYGTKVFTRKTGRHMYALSPTPELWSRSLSHRTQIIYTMDASVISFRMDLCPGSVVVESGTGSGSLSHHFARCIMPTGHLHTFEFNESRVLAARKEFEKNGIEKFTTVRHRDVCKNGFTDALNEKADAVFLDLPQPSKAIPHAAKALKPNGYICSFSPCIEQVSRTCDALRANGFNRLYICETLTKQFHVKNRDITFPPCFMASKPLPDEILNKQTEEKQTNSTVKNKSTTDTRENKKRKLIETKPQPIMKGHTSFLTFARKLPETIVEKSDS